MFLNKGIIFANFDINSVNINLAMLDDRFELDLYMFTYQQKFIYKSCLFAFWEFFKNSFKLVYNEASFDH